MNSQSLAPFTPHLEEWDTLYPFPTNPHLKG